VLGAGVADSVVVVVAEVPVASIGSPQRMQTAAPDFTTGSSRAQALVSPAVPALARPRLNPCRLSSVACMSVALHGTSVSGDGHAVRSA